MKEPVRISEAECPAAVLAAARRHVAQRWPDLAGAAPSITRRTQPAVTYTLTFSADLQAPDGHTIARAVRLTLDAQGKVLKSVGAK